MVYRIDDEKVDWGGVIKFCISIEIIFRQYLKNFFRYGFITEFIKVTFYAKKIFVVTRRIKSIRHIKNRKLVGMKVIGKPKENNIAGRRIQSVEIVKKILIPERTTLTFIFHTVR